VPKPTRRSGSRPSTSSPKRVLALRALTESPDVDGARAALRRYLKGGEITLTPELFEGRETYVARAEFLPLVFPDRKCSNTLRELPGRALSTLGCAGAIPRVDRELFPGFRKARGLNVPPTLPVERSDGGRVPC